MPNTIWVCFKILTNIVMKIEQSQKFLRNQIEMKHEKLQHTKEVENHGEGEGAGDEASDPAKLPAGIQRALDHFRLGQAADEVAGTGPFLGDPATKGEEDKTARRHGHGHDERGRVPEQAGLLEEAEVRRDHQGGKKEHGPQANDTIHKDSDHGVGFLMPGFVHLDPYNNLRLTFANPLWTGFYVLAMASLALHLYHGGWAVVRTLGVARPSREPLKRKVSLILAIVVATGFAIIPIAATLGVFKEAPPAVLMDGGAH